MPATKRGRRSVSPDTQWLTIAINGGSAVGFATLPTSPGCAPAAGGATSCLFTVSAPIGSDTFAVQTFTAQNGVLLDSAIMTQTIVGNAVNTVSIVLGAQVSTLADDGPGSLRNAVLDAQTGDTINFAVSGTIALRSPIGITKALTIAGPGATGPVTISGASATRIVTVAPATTATISGLTFDSGTASGDGGAIQNSGTLTLTNDTFSNNVAGGCGGALANGAGASVTISGSTFTNNSTTGTGTSTMNPNEGGAICSGGASLSISSSTFTNNATHDAPSRNGYGGAIVLYDNVTATIDGTTFQNNSSHAAGAIGIAGSNGVVETVTISNSTFSGNAATAGDSGAIENALSQISTTTITNSTFTSNTAVTDSGAIENDSPMVLNNVTFRNNSASGNGSGNIYSGDSGAMEQDDVLIATNVTFDGNTSHGDSGAMEQNDRAFFTNVTFTNNHAGQEAGALEDDSQTVINGGTFSGNSSDAYGGAYVEFSEANLTNVTIDHNSAVHEGGGMVIDSALFMNGCTISNNTVTGSTAGMAAGDDAGGGIFNADPGGNYPGIVINTTISGNSAPRGGGLGVGSVLIQAGSSPPPATQRHDAVVQLSFVTIANNTATTYGGNVYVFPSSTGAPSAIFRAPHGIPHPLKHRRTVLSRHPLALSIPPTPTPQPSVPYVTVNTVRFFGSIVGGRFASGLPLAPSGPDIWIGTGSVFNSQGYNVLQSISNYDFSTATGDILNQDPLLGPLQNNGGTTLTHALMTGSPAIDQIPPPSCTQTIDQRGSPRPNGAGTNCDIGAYEL